MKKFFLILMISTPSWAATPAEVVDFAIRQSTMAIPLQTVTGDNPFTIVYSTVPTPAQRRTAEAIARTANVSDAALSAFDATLSSLGTDTVFANSRPAQQLVAGVAMVLLDEINLLRQRDADRAAAVAAATTLADLKTRWAAISTLSQRTPSQARAAVKNKIDAGGAN